MDTKETQSVAGVHGGVVTNPDGTNVGIAPSVDSLIDAVDSTTTYIGKVTPGSVGNTPSAIWQIKKITTSGTITTISFADGNDSYDNIWDNRASLSYS